MKLNFELGQKQTVNQKLIHMVNLLQMNRQELLVYLEEQCMENPMLEMDESVYQYMPSQEQEDWIEQLEDTTESLAEVLLWQFMLEPHDPAEEAVVQDIVYNLDQNGFFKDTITDTAKRNHVGESFVKHCIEKVQSLEPAGIGAFSLEECLLIQLKRLPERNLLAEQLVESYLPLIGKNHLSRIAKETGSSIEAVQEACRLIKTLNPKPANGCGRKENIKYILPDVIIRRIGTELEIEFADHLENLVRIQNLYVGMEDIPKETREYIRLKTRQAEDVIDMIQNRQKTLQRIIEEIVLYQKEFFFYGQNERKTLTMQEIARSLDIHESTVSRAVSGKYFQCEWGVFPVKYLFAKGGLGSDTPTDQVKKRIWELIRQEDRAKPLSDSKLQECLTKEGYKISRRTVAKYRMQMNLRDAAGRKNEMEEKGGDE